MDKDKKDIDTALKDIKYGIDTNTFSKYLHSVSNIAVNNGYTFISNALPSKSKKEYNELMEYVLDDDVKEKIDLDIAIQTNRLLKTVITIIDIIISVVVTVGIGFGLYYYFFK